MPLIAEFHDNTANITALVMAPIHPNGKFTVLLRDDDADQIFPSTRLFVNQDAATQYAQFLVRPVHCKLTAL